MAAVGNYFPVTDYICPFIWSPEYDPVKDQHLPSKTFNKSTMIDVLSDPLGLLAGRNYSSFSDYINISTAMRIRERLSHIDDLMIHDLTNTSSGLPLVLMDSPNVSLYTSYINHTQVYDQFIRNVKIYNYGSKAIPVTDISSPSVFEAGSIVIMKSICHPLGLSYDQLMGFCRKTVKVFIIVNQKNCEPQQGYKMSVDQGFVIYINTDKVTHVDPLEKIPRELRETMFRRCLAGYISTPKYSMEYFEDIFEVQELNVDPLPPDYRLPSQIPNKKYNPSSLLTEKWRKEFSEFVKDIISKIYYEDPSDIFNQNTEKKYFLRAFVHETVNADNNYEALEKLGDSAMGYAFDAMILREEPQRTSAELSVIHSKMLSKSSLNNYSRKWGLHKFVIMQGIQVTDSVAEDLYESFCGAIVRAGDEYKRGLGIVLVENFVVTTMYEDLYGPKDASPEERQRYMQELEHKFLPDKFTLLTNYQGFFGESFKGYERETGDMSEYTVRITDQGYTNIRAMGIDTKSLAKTYKGIDMTPSFAREEAYNKLYHALNKVGLTYKFVEKQRDMKRKNATGALSDLWVEVDKIAKELGYDYINIIRSKSVTDLKQTVVILRAYKDTKSYNLKTLVHKNNKGMTTEHNARAAGMTLLHQYLVEYRSGKTKKSKMKK